VTEQLEQELRLRLLDLVDHRESEEERLAALLEARFPRELSVLDENRQTRHLEVLRKASSRRSWLSEWIKPLPPRSRPSWAVSLTLAAGLVALVGLTLFMPRAKPEHLARSTPPTLAPVPPDKDNRDPRFAQAEPHLREQPRVDRALSDTVTEPRLVEKNGQPIGRFVVLTGEPKWRLSQNKPSQPAVYGSPHPSRGRYRNG
jgi:hypothetical protein